ncbi:MAG: hypothetical protein KatS3mg099_282 [Candidatus Parcubacteria bacterium]|nr:MAG: hypothetical protein KatS3mg099_282 [Candidatus Parcubacteria bacterium]
MRHITRFRHFGVKPAAFAGLLSVVVGASVVAWRVPPADIATAVAAAGPYATLALLAFVGGVSVLVPFPYYLFTIAFGAAGYQPLLLGLAAGFGTFLGDITSYFVGKAAGEAGSKIQQFARLRKALERLFARHQRWVPVVAFGWAAVVPLPDDILTIPAGIARYPLPRLLAALLPGKILFNTFLALAGALGWEWVLSLFFQQANG